MLGAPLLSHTRRPRSKWKRKPQFQVRRGGLSLCARVSCRFASGFRSFQCLIYWRLVLNASFLSERSRSARLCRGAWWRRYQLEHAYRDMLHSPRRHPIGVRGSVWPATSKKPRVLLGAVIICLLLFAGYLCETFQRWIPLSEIYK
jgi:hypothetical protein